jgi:hypothetical protein
LKDAPRMQQTDHLHSKIARATTRLAQLQAQDLIAAQRKALRDRQQARRESERRKRRLAELVIAAGAQDLPDAEVTGALAHYVRERRDHNLQQQADLSGQRLLDAMLTQPNQP